MSEGTIQYQGQILTLSSCETKAFKDVPCFVPADGKAASLSCTTVVKKQDCLLHYQNAASSTASAGTAADNILTDWWRPVDCVQQTKQILSQHLGSDAGSHAVDLDLDDLSGVTCSEEDFVSCSSSLSSEIEAEAESGKDVEADDMYKELDKSTVKSSNEQLSHSIELLMSEEYQRRSISFPDEKLRLVYKIIISRCLEFRATVRVKLDKGMVKVFGTVDDIEHTDMRLHELIVNFVSSRVCISETSTKLLSTKMGEDWLDARLADEHLVGVFFVRDTMPLIMADCQDMLARVKHMIESSFVTKYRQMEYHHTKLLHSAIWSECAEDLQSAHLLRISVDYETTLRLVVEGCAKSAEVALDKLDKMLGENSRIGHCIKLRRGIYRVLCFRRGDIQQEAGYVVACCS